MVKNWVLIASKSKAKIFEIVKNKLHLKLIKKLENPKANKKNGELETDRPGVSRGPFNRTALLFKKGAQDHEIEIFSKQVIDEVNKGRNEGLYDKIIMVIDPGFRSYVENNLRDPLKKTIFQTIPKNYLNTPDIEVEKRLKSVFRESFNADQLKAA